MVDLVCVLRRHLFVFSRLSIEYFKIWYCYRFWSPGACPILNEIRRQKKNNRLLGRIYYLVQMAIKNEV